MKFLFKALNPFTQSSKTMFFIFLFRLLLMLVFLLLAALVCFGQDVTTGTWVDRAHGGAEATFNDDGTSIWLKSNPVLTDDEVQWIRTEWHFTYAIEGDKITLLRLTDNVTFIGKVVRCTPSHLTLLIKDGKLSTRYEFENENVQTFEPDENDWED